MPKYDYKTSYERENYFKITLRMPKDCQVKLQDLSKEQKKSMNQLILDAIEKMYGIDLTLKSNDCDRYIAKKLKILGELGVRNLNSVAELLHFESERSEVMSEKLKLIDIAYDKLINKL